MLRILNKYFDPQPTGDREYIVVCPFHDDSRPSLSINIGRKVFICHACGKKGKFVDLIAAKMGAPPDVVTEELIDTLPEYDSKHLIKKLQDAKSVLEFLQHKRKWSLDLIASEQIGWDGQRVTIPVRNIFGEVVNVRRYKPNASHGEAKMINTKNFGSARLYGVHDLYPATNKLVVVCEGEPDALALRSLGYQAVTATSGAKHFSTNWAAFFAGRDVVVVYDNDEPGALGARRAASIIATRAKTVKIATVTEVKDVTDWIVLGRDITSILNGAVPYALQESDSEHDEAVYPVGLHEASNKAYHYKNVEIPVMVTGKTLAPYIIPKEVDITCSDPKLKMCAACKLCGTGRRRLTFGPATPEIIQLIEETTDKHDMVFRRMAGVPTTCKIHNVTMLATQNVEEAKVIPNLDSMTDEELEYVMRQIYCVDMESVKVNTPYSMVGVTIPHPKTQQVTFLIRACTPLEDTISTFKLTDEVIKMLEVFSVAREGSTEAKSDLQ